MEPKVKTIAVNYIVKVNKQPIQEFSSVWEAKRHINSLIINDDINTVEIVKQTTQETIIKSFQTKVAKVLIATDLDSGLEGEFE
jgi:hypothetical protein